MKELNFFEKAGFSREESLLLEKEYIRNNIPFHSMLATLNQFKKADNKIEQLNKLIVNIKS